MKLCELYLRGFDSRSIIGDYRLSHFQLGLIDGIDQALPFGFNPFFCNFNSLEKLDVSVRIVVAPHGLWLCRFCGVNDENKKNCKRNQSFWHD